MAASTANKFPLTKEQKNNFLAFIQYKCASFPRGQFINKLREADTAYHLAKVSLSEEQEEVLKKSQLESRFPDLEVALVREIAETYGVKYITTFLGKQTIFQMTASGADPENKKDVTAFNTIFQDQQRELKWRANLAKALIDVSKYNFCAIDADWVYRRHYNLSAETQASVTNSNVRREAVTWSGNQLKWVDPYNILFDHTVDVDKLATDGDWQGYLGTYSQAALKKLVDELRLDPAMSLYLNDEEIADFSIFTSVTGSGSGLNMHYVTPDLVTSGSENSEIEKVNWVAHSSGGGRTPTSRKTNVDPANGYTVGKFIVRVVPGSFGIGNKTIEEDELCFYTLYVLEGTRIIASKKHTNLHGKLPIVVGQTDSDALRYNTSGPTQIALPYQRTAKAMQDRVLAAADRAIGDRALFDSNYIKKDDLAAKIPDPKIALRKSLTGSKTFQQVYYSIPFQGGEVFRLADYALKVQEDGRKASGINAAQQGQFVPGNKTLEEYNDTMINANDKLYVRALALESGIFTDLKYILKLNVIQYQQRATLYSEEAKTEITINPSELYKARVEFQIADALMPSKFMMSPNVQQQLLQYLGVAPEVFSEYDVPRLIGDIIIQSNGVPLDDYKLTAPDTPQQGN